MKNPTAAMLVIGDEILSGRTRDSNMHHLACELSERGIDLQEARMVPDIHERIVEAIHSLSRNHDHVFTCGGIGPPHDDITADAVASAFDAEIDVREDARELLARQCERVGIELNEARLRMARIPEGAELIENSVSAAPGFSIRNVHVLAGVPKIFQAMLSVLLERIPGGSPLCRREVEVHNVEGEMAFPLERIARRHSDVQIGSYPYRKDGSFGVNIVIRGTDPQSVSLVESEVRETFSEHIAT